VAGKNGAFEAQKYIMIDSYGVAVKQNPFMNADYLTVMKRLIIALIAIILSLSLLPSISAKSSDVFIDYLTNMMWNDCQGKDIHINQPVIMDKTTNQSVNRIKWPYDKNTIHEIVRVFGEEQQIFTTFFGTCEYYNNSTRIEGIKGCGILTSGSNKLDINGYNYFWNGVKVDVPQENLNFKMTNAPNSSIIETHGENSPVTTGSNSPITQDSIWVQLLEPKVTILGVVIGILIKEVAERIMAFYKNRNKKLELPK